MRPGAARRGPVPQSRTTPCSTGRAIASSCFNKLKSFRRFATLYDRLAAPFATSMQAQGVSRTEAVDQLAPQRLDLALQGSELRRGRPARAGDDPDAAVDDGEGLGMAAKAQPQVQEVGETVVHGGEDLGWTNIAWPSKRRASTELGVHSQAPKLTFKARKLR